jgi:hypothetical protein
VDTERNCGLIGNRGLVVTSLREKYDRITQVAHQTRIIHNPEPRILPCIYRLRLAKAKRRVPINDEHMTHTSSRVTT